MISSNLIGLPLEEALLSCAEQGVIPSVTQTRSPKDKSTEGRSARVVAVRKNGAQLCLVVAFFSDAGSKEAQHAAG